MTETFEERAVRQIAAMEGAMSVTAGSLNSEAFYRRVARQQASLQEKDSPNATVLGLFLNMARERALTIEQLAVQVDSDPLELFMVEEGHKIPEPRIVSKLARALEVPPGRLMQLAGHVQSLDKEIAIAAYKFAAHANTKPLEPQEREALHEFVRALGGEPRQGIEPKEEAALLAQHLP